MTTKATTKNMINSADALRRLKEGNKRFVSNTISLNTLSHQERREKLLGAQSPFAIILSCADSRAPAEFIFDQGLGDLFVIRVAGNIVAPSLIGSIEFAASTFGTQLVVVMGHSHCGAVSAALDVEQLGHGIPSNNIRDIVDRITPAIRPLIFKNEQELNKEPRSQILQRCITANIHASVSQIKHGSKIIEDLVQQNRLMIVGAEYSLETGRVEFHESFPKNYSAPFQTENDFISEQHHGDLANDQLQHS